MKQFYILAAVFWVLGMRPVTALCWGETGHQIVARLAYEDLSPAARQNLDKCLGGMTPEQAGNWMDELRSDHRYDFMKPWHYINIEKGLTYRPSTDENAVLAILTAYRELSHRATLCTDQERKDALVLIHLVGDLHQPLHAGYAADLGGNRIKLVLDKNETNLHALWDSELIRYSGINLNRCRKVADSLKNSDTVGKTGTPDVATWVNESRSLLPQIYDLQEESVSPSYIMVATPVIERQLAQAGIRLAEILNALFSTGQSVSSQASTSNCNQEGQQKATEDGVLTPEEASQHIGEQRTVCGRVFGGKHISSGVTFLNLGAPYPQTSFSIVIFDKDRPKFSQSPEILFNNKTICVSGEIKEFKGRSEIIAMSPEQINTDHVTDSNSRDQQRHQFINLK